MKTLGYYNGRFDEIENMMIPMNDRVCYFGDGVYDAGPCRNYKIFAIDEHVDRFFENAGLLQIGLPCTRSAFKDLLCDLVKKLDSGDLFVYYQLTRGTGPRAHEFTDGPGNLWVMIQPAPAPQKAEKIRLITLEDTRFLHCNIKTLNLIPSVMASQKAREAGCQEAVFHRGDRVTECAHSNCHILQDGVLITAPLDHLILPGIARAHMIRMCGSLGIPVEERPFTLKELMAADEVLVTSSSKFCLSAGEVDGRPVGGRAPRLLERLQRGLEEEFLEETR